MLAQLFQNRFKFDGKSTRSSGRKKFKPLLARDYLKIKLQEYYQLNSITCQILGIKLPTFIVIGSHVFKHEWAEDAEILLGIKNIDSTRNGFLLFQPIEKAYHHRSQLCFVKEQKDSSFCLKILDPSLREQDLLAACKPFLSDTICAKAGISVDQAASDIAEALGQANISKFGDLEGRPLICNGITRPYKRCLNFHASRARSHALEKGWISGNVNFQYCWSENFDETVLEKYFMTLEPSFEDPNVITNDGPASFADDWAPEDSYDSYENSEVS